MSSQRIIEKIHAEDIERARAYIRAGIDRARAEWTPLNAIADAMTAELLALTEPVSIARRDEMAAATTGVCRSCDDKRN